MITGLLLAASLSAAPHDPVVDKYIHDNGVMFEQYLTGNDIIFARFQCDVDRYTGTRRAGDNCICVNHHRKDVLPDMASLAPSKNACPAKSDHKPPQDAPE